MNGAQMKTAAANFYLPTYTPSLGQAANAAPFDGEIVEVLIFNKALTSGERAAVQNYINNRFSIW